MTLDQTTEARVYDALALLTSAAPPAPDIEDLERPKPNDPPPTRVRSGLIAIGAFALVVAAMLPLAMLLGNERSPEESDTSPPPTSGPIFGPPQQLSVPGLEAGPYAFVGSADDVLYMLTGGGGALLQSGDSGANWSTLAVASPDDPMELAAAADDGHVFAIHNSNDLLEGAGARNRPPDIAIFDPEQEEWTRYALPRPEAGSPVVSSGDCEEIESWVDGISILASDPRIVLGSHLVGVEGSCPKNEGLIWISPNDVDWSTVTLEFGPFDLLSTDFGYVAVGNAEDSLGLRAWTSPDTETWIESDVPRPELADGQFLGDFSAASGAKGFVVTAAIYGYSAESSPAIEGRAQPVTEATVVFQSLDGASWETTTIPGLIRATPVAGEDGFLLFPRIDRSDPALASMPFTVFDSPDGVEWDPSFTLDADVFNAGVITATDIYVLTESFGTRQPVMWRVPITN